MRFSRVLSHTSLRSRAIRHRIIRGQVRCGPRQLGKLEGVVFYFRNIQHAPRASLIFPSASSAFLRSLPPQAILFCWSRELVRQCNRLRNSTTNDPYKPHPLQALSLFLFFSHASGCGYRSHSERTLSGLTFEFRISQRIKIEIEAERRSKGKKRISL